MELERHLRRLESLAASFGWWIRVVLHAEYQAAKWLDEEFVERYVDATARALDVIVNRTGAERVEIELHSGFSSESGWLEWQSILARMVEYLAAVVSAAEERG
jgi:hypothetical protein